MLYGKIKKAPINRGLNKWVLKNYMNNKASP
jgi:hypothetical protein